jgi:DNA-binding CsgD family transcriptional regulator
MSERRLITKRQAEAMSYLAAGFKREKAAELMDISIWTLASQIRHVFIKWHVHNIKDALTIWEEEKWKYK